MVRILINKRCLKTIKPVNEVVSGNTALQKYSVLSLKCIVKPLSNLSTLDYFRCIDDLCTFKDNEFENNYDKSYPNEPVLESEKSILQPV